MQPPSPGRIVLVAVDPAVNAGSPVAPAVITRATPVGAQWTVNLRVLRDDPRPDWRWDHLTEVPLLDQPPEPLPDGAPLEPAAWWPPRVGA